MTLVNVDGKKFRSMPLQGGGMPINQQTITGSVFRSTPK